MAGENYYPNVDNYPTPSFKSPIPPPDVDPGEGELLYVAYSVWWAEVLAAACMALLQPSTWQGDHDAVITAQNRANDLLMLLQTPSEASIPTPFWDTGEDVDDQEPADMQPWYGYTTQTEHAPETGDFVLDAAIFVLTGLLAIATVEVGAYPAILFNTLAKRLVVANRRGDVGEVIKIWFDGQEAATVDTSSYAPGDIIRTTVIGDPDEEMHALAIVQVS